VPSAVNAKPLATMCCEPAVSAAVRPAGVIVTVPGGRPRTSRPTPPAMTSLTIGCTRNCSRATPSAPARQTRPWPVPPSEIHSAPDRSNARPFAPGTPLVNTVAAGGFAASGTKDTTVSPFATYSRPRRSNASPAGLHGAGIVPTTAAGPPVAATR
jgi:hypothetical protein